MSISPMMAQYLNTKEAYKDCILFYRLGDFYEMFFDDARLASKELGLTLTGKDCGLEERAPMCGVPFHAYESYVAKLINKGYKVAICEQITEPGKGVKLVGRDVVRIITPGTVVDSSMLDENKNTYIMSIYKVGNTISYAYLDVSCGEFFCGMDISNRPINYINDQIVRIAPSEIICNQEMFDEASSLPVVMTKSARLNPYYDWCFNFEECAKSIRDTYKITSLKGYDFDSKPCVIACGVLLQYVKETQKRDLTHLKMPSLVKDEKYMYIDTNTRKNLELESTMREGGKYGSLLWVLDKTSTNGGARLLRSFLREPLQDKSEIERRLNTVDAIIKNSTLRITLEQELKNIQDIERIVGKISYGNVMPKDFLGLKSSLEVVPNIKNLLLSSNDAYLSNLGKQIGDYTQIQGMITNTIDELSPAILKEGGYIKKGFDAELDRLRGLSTNGRQFILDLEQKEREITGIKNLKIGYNKVFGYYIEVNKQYQEQVPFRYVRKQTVSNNERYITEELKSFEEAVLTSNEKALKLEEEIYAKFRNEMLAYSKVLQDLASTISYIDVMTSFAFVSINNNYCKPSINTNGLIEIKNGRHPVIELLQKSNTFISNDTLLDDDENRTMILTGPNMAGKSTYMRQVALITFMAHIGCFVPAEKANISLVDRIFTRIGASDDLAVGQSTFMVEMVEVSNILRFATDKSLIILDEVGRGTSTHDGLSIAWSVVEFVSKTLKCKTLFATHYHELMNLEGNLDGVKNYCLSIKEIAGELVFLRKIMRGSATKSYGIEVANLAGLPREVISRAKVILNNLENNKENTTNSHSESEILDILKHTDMNTLSPLLAFDLLARLVEKSKE